MPTLERVRNTSCNWSYTQWHEALRAAFLEPVNPGQPFMFFLDQDEADRLWPKHESPAEDLARAVSNKLNWAGKSTLFSGIGTTAVESGGPPCTLPLLAVTVLAAAQMQRDEVATASAYFLRLAQVLRPELTTRQVADPIAAQISKSFDTVRDMWKSFDRWIRSHEDTAGPSTITDHPNPARIGYPLSQALIRRSDRMCLTHFFEDARMAKSAVPSGPAILENLKIWADSPRGLSPTFLRTLGEPTLRDALTEHVVRLATAWDGVALTPDGRRRLKPRLALDIDRLVCRWLLPVLEGIETGRIKLNDQPFTIHAPEYGKFYEIEGTPPAVNSVLTSLSVVSAFCAGSFDMPTILAFREDPDAGCWVSCDGMTAYEEHVLVVRPDLGPALEETLHKAAQRGWRKVRQTPPNAPLSKRLIYHGVLLADAESFEAAMQGLAPDLARGLRPQTLFRSHLVNGLPVAERLGRNHYLPGGEPDLLIPVGTEARYVEASLDGKEQTPPFRATGFPIELRRQGPLAEGSHRLVVGDDTLTFHIHARLPAAEQKTHLGWRLDTTTAVPEQVPPGSEQDFIRGAAAPGYTDEPEPILVRRRHQLYVSDKRGRCILQTQPPTSTLFTRMDIPASQFWEYTPNPSGVWMIEVKRGVSQIPRRLTWAPPAFGALDKISTELWNDIASRHRNQSPLLDNYIKAWKR